MSVLKLLKLEIPKDTMKKIKSLIVGIVKAVILILIPLATSSITLIASLRLVGLAEGVVESLDYGSYENIIASIGRAVINMLPLIHLAIIALAISAGILTGAALAYWLNQRHYEKEIKRK
jgi:hypothetical protein